MGRDQELYERCGSVCELCASDNNLAVYKVSHVPIGFDDRILICETCLAQIQEGMTLNVDHWRCLNNSMWNSEPAVQVIVWRLLNRLKNEGWPQDLLDMLYLDEKVLEWARAAGGDVGATERVVHKDSNGAILSSGDTVLLIKDLEVKGGGFTAKRGTAVRSIALVENNAAQIEGRVNGQQIVILTQFVKKSS